jgi:SAM-dependent methyltransferase
MDFERMKYWFTERYRYIALRSPKRKGAIAQPPRKLKKILGELKAAGFDLQDIRIDVTDYRRYLEAADYERSGAYYKVAKEQKIFSEKSLEHYLAAKLLAVGADDVYIDVASQGSPVPDIYERLYGCKIYKQDLIYEEGLHGDVIGGDAAQMPVEAEFASKMGLHCSFEHFEGDADVRFIREADRVLRPGGRLCILPLYMNDEYSIQTDLMILPKEGMEFESEAAVYYAKGWGQRHGRFYDAAQLGRRIKGNLGDLSMTIYVVENEKEVDKYCYLKLAALFEKK